jgi:DNA topoisomerase-1
MLETIFGELDKNHDEIRGVLYEGLREDKIIGKCQVCGSDLMVRKSKRGSRFIGCSGYPNCTFSLPLPPSGNIVATNKMCETHGLSHIKIVTGGKKPWELGCPQCNFEAWQKEKEKKAAEAGTAETSGTATAPKRKAAPKKKKAEEKPPAA